MKGIYKTDCCQFPQGRLGICTIFMHSKNNVLQQCQALSFVGEGWDEEDKINELFSPSSHPSTSREKGHSLV
jgi:hypothetical protein